MSTDRTPSQATDDLQFDRALPADSNSAHTDEAMPRCSVCSQAIPDEYYTIEGAPVCAPCKTATAQQAEPVRDWSVVFKSGLLGLGAAILGAAIYYGVIAVTQFEIGLVAILIGYMVGYAVRKGAGGRGGRRLQVVAVALTYFAVALAYLPIVIKGAADAANGEGVSIVDSLTVASSDTLNSTAPATPEFSANSAEAVPTTTGVVVAIGMMLLGTLLLPILVVFGSLPSGLISALIIGFGMHQAWSMTRAPSLTIHGPYKVGAGPQRQASAGATL